MCDLLSPHDRMRSCSGIRFFEDVPWRCLSPRTSSERSFSPFLSRNRFGQMLEKVVDIPIVEINLPENVLDRL